MGNTEDPGTDLGQFMSGLRRRNPGETEFHQAVQEVAMHILPYIADKPEYRQKQEFGGGKGKGKGRGRPRRRRRSGNRQQ